MKRSARMSTSLAFQSTPANFTAGDGHDVGGEICPHLGFNPRPPISQRATRARSQARGARHRFNPRPPISQRATNPGILQRLHRLVSIHARQFHSGRRRKHLQRARRPAVSIHARQFHSGRRRDDAQIVRLMAEFQSTPANFTAGDGGWAAFPLPTHSGFQSTPANFTAGDPAGQAPADPAAARFNPRPPISQRATTTPARKRHQSQVSIHARQFHSGRPPAHCYSNEMDMLFQSTPANFTAGDTPAGSKPASQQRCFNPRPPISQRATGAGQGAALPVPVSIHARQFHSGRHAPHR